MQNNLSRLIVACNISFFGLLHFLAAAAACCNCNCNKLLPLPFKPIAVAAADDDDDTPPLPPTCASIMPIAVAAMTLKRQHGNVCLTCPMRHAACGNRDATYAILQAAAYFVFVFFLFWLQIF